MNARLYDVGAGIFTSVDPVFADMYRTGGLNAYGYVYGNPFSFIDPTGRNGLKPIDESYLNQINIVLGFTTDYVDTHGIVPTAVEVAARNSWNAVVSDDQELSTELWNSSGVADGFGGAAFLGFDMKEASLESASLYGRGVLDLKPTGTAFGFGKLGPELHLLIVGIDDIINVSKTTYIFGVLAVTFYEDSYGVNRGGSISGAIGLGRYSSQGCEGVITTPDTFFNPHGFRAPEGFDHFVEYMKGL